MGHQDFTLYNLIVSNAMTYGEKTAWYETETQEAYSFRALERKTLQLAAGLQALGIQKGDRIGVLGKNRIEFFLLYGAAAAIGAVMCPVNFRLATDEMVHILSDSAVRILFVDKACIEKVGPIMAKDLPIEYCYALSDGFDGYGTLASLYRAQENFVPVNVSNNDPAVIIYTAAVGGEARGAVLTHGNLICGSLAFMTVLSLRATDVHLHLLPLFHVGGFLMALCSFQAGAENVNMLKYDDQRAADLIATKEVTVLFDFTPILSGILQAAGKNKQIIRSLCKVIGLETPETIEAYQKQSGGIFYQIFGQTETTGMITACPYDERPGAAGKVIPIAEVAIVDAEDRPLPPGQSGEIVTRGPLVFKEYLNLPEVTAETFRNGWHHTGDLGHMDPEGYLFYEGRKPEKELIKPGGENVYPAEVEKVILSHPAIAQTVVFGVPDPKWKEGIKAVCQLKPGQKMTAQELIDFVGARIARYKKPHNVEFIEKIPTNADGAPDRLAIKRQYG